MGYMQRSLEHLLKQHGRVTRGTIARPTWADIESAGLGAAAALVYRQLGGILAVSPSRVGPWDIEFEGFAVELDEHLHFNRYRAITLQSPIYERLPRFPRHEYARYCSEYEKSCLRAGGYGGKWTNNSCEKQFGPAAEPRDLSDRGAPRWKQRAFYDFVKDLSPLVSDVELVRISIWDSLPAPMSGRTVQTALMQPSDEATRGLVDLLDSRRR